MNNVDMLTEREKKRENCSVNNESTLISQDAVQLLDIPAGLDQLDRYIESLITYWPVISFSANMMEVPV